MMRVRKKISALYVSPDVLNSTIIGDRANIRVLIKATWLSNKFRARKNNKGGVIK